MPHKKNPIASERIAGMARIVRAQVVPVMEGIPLWHERDISHSSTERVALPDASIATDYLLHLTTRLVTGLVVDPDRMRANLESSHGLIYTSTVLLELVESGLSREDAYAFVQAAAMQTWETGRPFRETLTEQAAAEGQALDEARLDEVCRPERYLERLAPGLRAARRALTLTPSRPLPLLARGKVRDVYEVDDEHLLLVASDRLSAYDVVLPTAVPDKGAVLDRPVAWWFEQLEDVVPNHLVDGPHCRPAPTRLARSMLCRRLAMVQVECVARGYLTGGGLTDYRADRRRLRRRRCRPGSRTARACPSRSSRRRPRRAVGEHDEPITYDEVVDAGRRRAGRRAARRHAGVYRRGAARRRAGRHPARRHQDRARATTPPAC